MRYLFKSLFRAEMEWCRAARQRKRGGGAGEEEGLCLQFAENEGTGGIAYLSETLN